MQKNEIRALIFNVLPKYAQGSEYHKEVVDRAIEKAINQLYTETFLRDPLSINRYVKRFGTVTAIAVSQDAVAGIYYVPYTALGTDPMGDHIMPVPLPDSASGVRRIMTVAQSTGVKFFPISQVEMDLMAGSSFTKTVTDKIWYVTTQDRVEFYGMTSAIATAGVRMDVLIGFSDYSETDDILIPENPSITTSGQKSESATFTDLVLGILGIIRPQETVDDNQLTTQTKQ